MGYTIENKKIVIWTSKVAVADPWPFNDEATNYTYFYKNLKDKKPFAECLSVLNDMAKFKIVSKELKITEDSFILKSKKSHLKQLKK